MSLHSAVAFEPSSAPSVFSALVDAIPAATNTPLGLIGLLGVTGAATFLFWTQAKFKAEAKALLAVPEEDRREFVTRIHGPFPKNFSAQAWLMSQRQRYLLLAFVCTLATLLLGFIVLYGKINRPDHPAHHPELRKAYATLHSKLAAHELAGRNLYNAFWGASVRAVDPDQQTDADLTVAISGYNKVYDDLRQNRYEYESSVKRWLTEVPALADETSDVLNYGLIDVHQNAVKPLNVHVRAKAEEVRELRLKNDSAANARIEALKRDASQDIPTKLQALQEALNTYIKEIDILTQRMGE